MALHLFTIGDIPVRVSLWYGLLLFYWFRGSEDPKDTLLWVLVVTVSILVHEFGHALVARYYRLRPGILLHGLGGLCHHDRATQDRHDVFIIAAGPGAGLGLGVLTWIVSLIAPPALADTVWFGSVVSMSLYVNIGWSLVNLLPIWPLDGGQLFRLAALRLAKPARAEKITHYTALILLALSLWVASRYGGSMLLVMILWLAWSNISALRGESDTGPTRVTSKEAPQLLAEAVQAYERGDFKEAARLGHLLKRDANASTQVASEGNRLLGVSLARIGEHEEALVRLRSEKATGAVTEARIECLYALGRDDELDVLLRSDDFAQLAPERQAEIRAIVRPSPPPVAEPSRGPATEEGT